MTQTTINLFSSAVSDEFRSYREALCGVESDLEVR